jgi:hypothetical protein
MARRVRFDFDDHFHPAATNIKGVSPRRRVLAPVKIEVSSQEREGIGSLSFGDNRHAVFVESARIAEQRAQEAMALARAMKTNVRYRNTIINCKVSQHEQVSDKYVSGAQFNCEASNKQVGVQGINDENIMSSSIAWFNGVFKVNQSNRMQ